ncbi:MAG: DNA recombination protein RmuC [Chloroflexi bacterium]|nr:DNA recombination protein RmuC [Chloroflexota bacterium]
MDAGIIIVAAIVGASIVGAFIMMSRRGNDAGEDSSELVRLAEEKAKAESELASTRADLDTANQMLNDARQFEIQNAKLASDLANEQALHERVSGELKTTQTRRDTLQAQVQNLTAEISGLKAELEAKSASLQEETNENAELLKQATDLGAQVNALTAKVSNLKTELKNADERMEERGQLEKLFGDRFKTMSSETLANQQKQFIERASQTLKPLSDKVEKLDREWATTSGAFKQQVSSLADQTRALSTALSKPQGRGQWGEMQVERILEFSGLQEGIHYQAQVSDMKGGRTDFIVHMPHNRDIILDSKVPLVAYVDAHETEDENQRNAHLERFARHFQDHVNNLASKEYWSNLPKAADYVVMVVPDYAVPTALERRPNLIEEAHRQNVVISSQSNLVALLKTVAMGWQERKLTDEAIQIGLLGRELHDRLEVFATHYADIGTALDRAVNRYNRGVGSLESRVLTQARRFPELGVQTTKELPETQPVETTIRAMRTVPAIDEPSDNGA